jgi:hypothetical protein
VALKKGSICWLTIPQADGGELVRPAWYVQQGKQLFVLKGRRRTGAAGPRVRLHGHHHGQVQGRQGCHRELTADVRVVTDEAEFERIAVLGLGTRLNLPDGEGALQRWKDTATIVELSPRG